MKALFLAASLAVVPLTAMADGPEISTSVGARGGVVLLWPRVVPATDDPAIEALAGEVQAYLTELAERTGRPLDVRPAPQRACPRPKGCRAPTLSAVLAHQDGGCALVGLIGGVGTAPVDVIGWVGRVQVRERAVPFRAPPEEQLRVADFVPCDALLSRMSERSDQLADALREAIVAASSPR